jgi:hypothetical protein
MKHAPNEIDTAVALASFWTAFTLSVLWLTPLLLPTAKMPLWAFVCFILHVGFFTWVYYAKVRRK